MKFTKTFFLNNFVSCFKKLTHQFESMEIRETEFSLPVNTDLNLSSFYENRN